MERELSVAATKPIRAVPEPVGTVECDGNIEMELGKTSGARLEQACARERSSTDCCGASAG